MKRIIGFLLILTVDGLTAATPAQNCACGGSVPAEGIYLMQVDYASGTEAELIVGGGPDGSCGGAITLNADGRSTTFTCRGGIYEGIVPTDQGSFPAWLEPVGTDTASMGLVDSFEGLIEIPPNPYFQGKLTFNRLSGNPGAPSCFCREVESWIDSARGMISLYSDQTILDQAWSYRQAGLQPGEVAWPDGVKNAARYETEHVVVGSDMVADDLPSYQTVIGERASVTVGTERQFRSAAYTDPITCEITNALPRSSEGTCRPAIVLEAIWLHEKEHSEKCLELTGGRQGAKNYLRWSNHPPNHAADEVNAYTVARDHMSAWHEANCD